MILKGATISSSNLKHRLLIRDHIQCRSIHDQDLNMVHSACSMIFNVGHKAPGHDPCPSRARQGIRIHLRIQAWDSPARIDDRQSLAADNRVAMMVARLAYHNPQQPCCLGSWTSVE
ncbi:hypothetical protein LIA77_10508 [Sarocladium implicatum]|nr:hypothetical protein LIA77_10508 [Sarocladium implicatum]